MLIFLKNDAYHLVDEEAKFCTKWGQKVEEVIKAKPTKKK